MADVESQKRCTSAKRLITIPLAVDGIIATTVIVFLLLVEFGLLPQVVKRGFYCDDRTITRKYNGDTISSAVIIGSTIVPLFLIWIAEAIFYSADNARPVELKKANTRLNVSWFETFYWFKKYARGIIINAVILDAVKIFLGELRPHFLDTCQPDAAFNCTPSEYITTYQCTNKLENHYFIRDASKSFPSGHASLSVFEAVFMIWFLERRVPKLNTIFLIPLCQMLLMFWATLCAISRITDNRHHWWDVLAGSILGLCSACLTCYFACNNFDKSKRRQTNPAVTNVADKKDYRAGDHKLIQSPGTRKDEINLNNVAAP